MKKYLLLIAIGFILSSCTEYSEPQPESPPPLKMSAELVASSFTPLDQLGTSTYNGRTGGLYTAGNTMPAAHATQFSKDCNAVRKDANPVFLALGASNTAMEFELFSEKYSQLSNRNTKLKLVNGCRGSQSLDKFTVDDYLSTFVPGILSANSVKATDVDVIWLKTSYLGREAQTMSFTDYVNWNVTMYTTVLKALNTQFPNCKIVMFSGRHNTWQISGSAAYGQHKEPVAYWDSWAIKDIINKQVSGSDFPYSSYPTYVWAFPFYTGKNSANSFGHMWNTSVDSRPDNPHPTDAGKENATTYMINYMSTDSNLKKFFLAK